MRGLTLSNLTRRSLRRELVLRLLAGAALLAVGLFLAVYGLTRQLAEESQDNVLSASVSAILETATVANGELIMDLPHAAFSMLANDHDDAVFYAIHTDDAFQSGYPELPQAPVTAPDRFGFETLRFLDQDIRLVTSERLIAAGDGLMRVSVTVGQTRLDQQVMLAQAGNYAVALGLGFFATAALLAVISARSAVKPLERLAGSVARRGPQDLRPVAAPVPSEMEPLVGALNRFIARLSTSLSRSEEFIAEAAHRVRTPLATVRMQAEVTLQRVEKEENRKSVREMIRAIDESSRAAGQLLDHAMVSFRADHLEQEEIDLAHLARDLVERLRPTADLRDISLSLEQQAPAQVRGDPILLQNALGNLVDNAIKYTRPDGHVRLRVGQDDGMARLQVLDDGIGFGDGDLSGLTLRYARGSNVASVVGSGLGLTIVDEVARAHGGRLELGNNPEGEGACVTLVLPLV